MVESEERVQYLFERVGSHLSGRAMEQALPDPSLGEVIGSVIAYPAPRTGLDPMEKP